MNIVAAVRVKNMLAALHLTIYQLVTQNRKPPRTVCPHARPLVLQPPFFIP